MQGLHMDLLLGTAFLYLLFSCVPGQRTASSEDGEEDQHVDGPALLPLKIARTVCAMKADSGPCKAIHSRYHFNIETRQCEMFDYGGCEGNDNNFLTLEECQEKCIVKEPPSDQSWGEIPTGDLPDKRKRTRFKKEKPSYCLLENDPGICRGLFSRYFYNSESQQCEKFMYGGCLGNQNNFMSFEECQDTCEDTPNSLQTDDDDRMRLTEMNNSTPTAKQELPLVPSLCMMHMERGPCRANEKRFFFNFSTGKCHRFSYSGCGGNENNFTSRKACRQMCRKGFILKQGQGLMKIHRRKRKQ